MIAALKGLRQPWLGGRIAGFRARLAIVGRLGLRTAWQRRRLNQRYTAVSRSVQKRLVDEMWLEAAAELGAETRRLTPTLREFRRGDDVAHVAYLTTTPLTDQATFELTHDKQTSLGLLAAAGIPVPEHVVVEGRDAAAATEFLQRVGGPLVVKPVRSKGGSGVVGHVSTEPQLKRALQNARRYDRSVLIERQIEGDSYRLLYLDGKLLDVIRRPPPMLEGDGVSTIRKLVRLEYERRIAAGGDSAGWKPFDLDLDCLTVLEHGGHDLDSVLAAGELIPIKSATNYTGPDATETYRGALSDGLLAAAAASVDVLGPRLAGVDLITTDPTVSLEEAGGVVLEVNALPGLLHHYQVADRERATRVAIPVLERLLERPTRALPYRPELH